MRNLAIFLGFSTTLLAAGCLPADEPPATLASEGSYRVSSHFDLTVETALPPQASAALELVRRLRDDPAATLIDAAGEATSSELIDALPGPLQDRLAGFIDDAIRSAPYDGATGGAALDELFARVELVLGGFDVDSTMMVSEDPDGELVHAPRALRFQTGPGEQVSIGNDGNLVARIPAHRRGVDAARDSLAIDEHGFGFDYGEMLWQALDESAMQRWRTDLRTMLRGAVDCDAMAASVAAQCVLGACVGHETELHDLCGLGRQTILDEVEAQIRDLRIELLHLADGQAQLVDLAPADGTADQITDGSWSASIDFGDGARPLPSRFAGVRE
jgi:hypothetical protein